jgi:sterol carrier protein 2
VQEIAHHSKTSDFSPTSDGAGCCILASEDFVKKHNLQGQAVEIIAHQMRTDFSSTFQDQSATKVIGYDMTKAAADAAFKQSGMHCP